MSGGSDQTAHEIVIVRRHGGDHEEGHHGGAWKIAYADFMTAMMAFFLVMWLIISTDDKTPLSLRCFKKPSTETVTFTLFKYQTKSAISSIVIQP